jgi:tryptophan-rich sensory protein
MLLHKSLKRIATLFIFIIICLFVGALGGAATESSRTSWYSGLQKPYLNPPDWIFAPVWTTLYLFIAIAGWRIWNAHIPNRNSMRFLFIAQLALNGAWSFLFFGLRNPLTGLVDIVLLWIFLLALVRLSWQEERISSYLLTPYLLWVSFAAYLNAGIWWLNL